MIDELLALQDQDGVIRSLEQEIRDIPVRIEQELARLSTEQEAVESAKASLAILRADKEDSDNQVQAAEKQIKDMETSKLSLTTNREYSETNALIEVKKQDLEKLTNANLSFEQALAPAQESLKEAQERYDAAKAEVDAYVVELEARLKDVEAELNQARDARFELADKLRNPEGMRFLMSYERISTDDPSRGKKGKWPAVVKVEPENRVCQGCHMVLTPAKVQDVALAHSVIVCDYCGRMLYTEK